MCDMFCLPLMNPETFLPLEVPEITMATESSSLSD